MSLKIPKISVKKTNKNLKNESILKFLENAKKKLIFMSFLSSYRNNKIVHKSLQDLKFEDFLFKE